MESQTPFRAPFELPTNLDSDPPIVIVGAGPAGSAAALAAKRAGHKVLVVTKYPFAARSKMVFLSRRAMASLEEFRDKGDEDDDKFFKKLAVLPIILFRLNQWKSILPGK